MSGKEEYKKIYLQESDELLQLLNSSLLVLEKDRSDSEALNAIFRAAHTLKSMSASMGYNDISDLSHKMEDLLSQVRDGESVLDEKEITILFSCVDTLERMVTAVAESKTFNGDVLSLINSLNSSIKKEHVFEEEKISEDISLNVFEKRTLARVKKDGYNCYHLKVTLDQGCVLKSVRAFMVFRALHEIGEVIKSFPDSESIEGDKFDLSFGCVFITREPSKSVKDRVADILEIADVAVSEIPVEDDWYDYDDSSSQTNVEDARKKIGQQAEQIKKISSVRVDVQRLDRLMNLVEELVIAKLRIGEIADRLGEAELRASIDPLNRLADELQNEIMQARLVPVAQIFDRFPRIVRDLALKESKKIRFEMIGGDIELDRAVLDEIADPLIHLIRNAVDHGIARPEERKKNKKAEEGRVMLSAVREKNHVVISVSDDGEGVDISAVKMRAIENGFATEAQLSQMSESEILMMIALPGFSTAKSVSEISGRGVGMDVVKNKTEMLGGAILLESKAHLGTKMSMKIPITTAVVKSLIVGVEERFFAFPISSVVEIAPVTSLNIRSIENAETIVHRGEVIPLMRINEILSAKNPGADSVYEKSSKGYALIVDDGERKYAAMVDRLLNQQDIVIKQLSKEFKGVKGIAGATILGSGSIALVVDVVTLN